MSEFSREEEKRMKQLLSGREPTSIERALFSALWSEHCSYKSSKVHLKKFSHQSKKVLSPPGENAGVIDLGFGEKMAFKMESHNHPSFIEPFHGAMTGVGGILRDVFAMNARPMALANYLCFGPFASSLSQKLLDGVVRGIGGYGNCIGIPTITGRTFFDKEYSENILVNALAVGYLGPSDEIIGSTIKHTGALVLYAGAMTGRDGIHGASMASASFEENAAQKQSTVQVGDPFYGKLLMESCLEAMGQGLVLACQDMGAAGLSSSSFEMASKSELGMTIDLKKIPLRDQSMKPEDILLSESQERMLLICDPKNYSKLKNIFDQWDLPLVVIGEVIPERKMKLYWGEKQLASLDPWLFTNNAPKYSRPYKAWAFPNEAKNVSKTKSSKKINVLELLKNPNHFSREFIYQQYDQRVGAGTAGDASFPIGVVRLPSKRFLGLTLGGRPSIYKTDAFIGGIDSLLEPALELSGRGFEPLAVTDCLNFGNPEKEHIMSQFAAAVEGMAQASRKLELPVVSGNVSFYNESSGKNIIPTGAVGVVGLKESWPWPRAHFEAGEKIYLIKKHECFLNSTFEDPSFFCGRLGENLSDFHIWMHKILSIAKENELKSVRLVGKGGLSYALCRMAVKGGVGAAVKSECDPLQERLYEFIMTVKKTKGPQFEAKLKKLSLDFECIGQTGGGVLSYEGVFSHSVAELTKAYCEPLA